MFQTDLLTSLLAWPEWHLVNGHWFLPTGGQLMCPLVASKTAR